MDDENAGGLACGVILEMVLAIEQSRHLIKLSSESKKERAHALSETDEELDVAREDGFD